VALVLVNDGGLVMVEGGVVGGGSDGAEVAVGYPPYGFFSQNARIGSFSCEELCFWGGKIL